MLVQYGPTVSVHIYFNTLPLGLQAHFDLGDPMPSEGKQNLSVSENTNTQATFQPWLGLWAYLNTLRNDRLGYLN